MASEKDEQISEGPQRSLAPRLRLPWTGPAAPRMLLGQKIMLFTMLMRYCFRESSVGTKAEGSCHV